MEMRSCYLSAIASAADTEETAPPSEMSFWYLTAMTSYACIRSGFPVTISVSRFFLDACKRNPHPKLNALAGIYYLLIIM
jgi:hypothetical protein